MAVRICVGLHRHRGHVHAQRLVELPGVAVRHGHAQVCVSRVLGELVPFELGVAKGPQIFQTTHH